MSSLIRLLKEHFWGVLLLVVLLIGSGIVVRAWKAKHPGAMSVLESQAMDMTVMKPPVGAVPVATEVAHLGAFAAKVTYTGSVAPLQEQTIYPRVEGYLKSLSVYNGDSVSAGQLLAVVDSPDLQSKVAEAAAGHLAAAGEVSTARYDVARMAAENAASRGEVQAAKSDLARAKAMLNAMRKTIAQRQTEVKSAKANLDYWNAEIAREEKLLKAGAVSVQEYQSEKAQAVAAQAELENKEAMLEEARANVEASEAEVANKQFMVSVASQRVSAASAALSGAGSEVRQKAAMAGQARAMVSTAATIDQYRYVKAPFAGTVTKRYVSPGQFVTPATAVANVVQMDQVRLQANVSDKDLDGISIGAPVVARFVKNPRMRIEAEVTSVSPLADQASRTAVVEAVVPNPGHRLLPGDAVTLDIAVSGRSDAISVPASAIVQKDGMPAVWITRIVASKGKKEFYCTMHPEVVSDRPGDCPKCLMKLVPKTSDGNKKAHLVAVITGSTDGERVEITSGLKDGDEVIYQGNTYLKEGNTVFPTKWGPDGPTTMPQAPGMGDMPGMDHGSGDRDKMPGMDHSSGDMGDMPGMDHSRMKTDAAKSPSKTVKAGESGKVYVCPMHPHEMSHNPKDRCKLCGMKLELKK